MIRKKAKTEGWEKGAAAAIRERAHELADEAGLPSPPTDAEGRIEDLAKIGSQVLQTHRGDIRLMRNVTRAHVLELQELQEARDRYAERIERFYEQMLLECDNPAKRDAIKKEMRNALHAISLPIRSKTLLNLVSASRTLIELERQAYRLDEEKSDKTFEEALRELAQGAPA